MLYDEPTSALDSISEDAIDRVLHASEANRTCVVVAHKLRLVQDADLILVMSNGTLVEQGTHAELLCRVNSTYSRMWAQQRHGNERWFEERGQPSWCPLPARGPAEGQYGDIQGDRRQYGAALQSIRDLAERDKSLNKARGGRMPGRGPPGSTGSPYGDGGGWLW